MQQNDIVMGKEYKIKSVELWEKVADAYRKIEDGVIKGYQAVENETFACGTGNNGSA